MHGVLDELHPSVALLSGTGMNFHHFGPFDARCDEEESTVLVGHLPHYQLLQRNDCGTLVLGAERQRESESVSLEGGTVKQMQRGRE